MAAECRLIAPVDYHGRPKIIYVSPRMVMGRSMARLAIGWLR
jgi:hypothetical protein